MHAQVEPHNEVLLQQALAIEELVEIDYWVVDILSCGCQWKVADFGGSSTRFPKIFSTYLAIIRVGRARFRILLLRDHQVILRPVGGVGQVAGVLDSEVDGAI